MLHASTVTIVLGRATVPLLTGELPVSNKHVHVPRGNLETEVVHRWIPLYLYLAIEIFGKAAMPLICNGLLLNHLNHRVIIIT